MAINDKSFDKFASEYDAILAESLHTTEADTLYFAQHKVALMARKLRDRAVHKVLDYGCGPGRSLPLLRRYFPAAEVCGFDPSEPCIAASRERFPDATLFSNLDRIPLAAFDAILLANVVHHIAPTARAETFRRIAAILAPAGSLFIVEHNPFNPVTRRVFERCPFDADAVMVTRKEIRALATAASLKPAASGYTLFFPPALRALRGLEPALAWLPLGAQHYARFEK